MFGERLNQVDFRMSKSFALPGSRRVQALVDLYNLFNASPVLALNNTFGPQWQRPTQILQGRLLKFGVPGRLLERVARARCRAGLKARQTRRT